MLLRPVTSRISSACWLALIAISAAAAAADGPSATRALVMALRKSGRAEVEVVQSWADASGADAQRGRLALEVPDRVRLDLPSTGERLTVRGDGGEWLQPATRQFLILRPEHAAAAARAWTILLDGGGSDFVESRRGPRRFVLLPRDPGTPVDSAVVTIDAHGLPARLEAWTPGGEPMVYEFKAWKFTGKKGTAAFTQRAPPGYAVIELP